MNATSPATTRVGGRQQGFRQLLMMASSLTLAALLLTVALVTTSLRSLIASAGPRAIYHGVLILLGSLLLGVVLHTLRTRGYHTAVRLAALAVLGLLATEAMLVFFFQTLVHSGLSLAVGSGLLAALLALNGAAWHVEPRIHPRNPDAPIPLWQDYLSLTKPRVISLLLVVTWAAMYMTGEALPSLALVGWTLLGGFLSAGGAHAINCYLDRDVDLQMGRTSRRPVPSNRIPAHHALILGIALGVLAAIQLSLTVNLLSAALATAGLLFYVFVYTMWLKRTTTQNIVIGGAAGAFPPLVGWAAVTNEVGLLPLLLFLIVFVWTPPHFWALALIRRVDYARAGVPMLPVVAGEAETRRQILIYAVAMVVVTLVPVALGLLGIGYAVAAGLLGGLFLRSAVQLLRAGDHPAAWRLYRYSLLYLALLFVAMMIDRLLVV